MTEADANLKPIPIIRTTTGSTDSDGRRKVSFASNARVSTGSKDENETVTVPTKAANAKRSTTADTFSDVSSATSGDSWGTYEVIEYDPSQQVHASTTTSLLSGGLDIPYEEDEELDYLGIEPAIGEGTPAAEALRASAAVRVSRVGKAARAVNMQAVRKLVKRATGTSKSGVVKGKPPRLPPTSGQQEWSDDEEDEEDDDQINETQVHQQTTPPPPSKPSPQQLIPKDPMPDNVVAGTAEAGKKVLGAVDPHDMLKVLRWRKKKKGQENKPKSYTKGKVIDGEHELYTLSIAVMIGVRTSISKTNNVLNSGPSKRWVLPQDYRTTEKYEFRPKGGTGMPSHQLAHTFKFKDYAPVVFAYLRRMAGINEFDFLISVCGNANFIEFISNAKSGQFFFYSSDGRYMIKTMTNVESKFLRRILPEYFRHCCENPNTMITRFFGMYRVKLYHLRRNVKFVIMNSVYYTDKYLQSFYDLKGSVVGRDAKPGQAVKKDNDLRRVLPGEALALPPIVRSRVRRQLEKDTKFLDEMGIMDYSMLVGVHHVPPAEDQSLATTGFRASSRKSFRRFLPEEGDAKNDRALTPRQRTHSADQKDESAPTPHSRRSINDEIGNLAFEDGLDDDDSSYLKGSGKRPKDITRLPEEIEQKKQATIEKLYWPFHHLYDIHGHRTLKLSKCATCEEAPCVCMPHESLQGYNVLRFEPPLSDRKDGGLEMDTTGLSLPLVYKGPNGDQLYMGKIFYMGIIDILQEYNSRKMVEAQYRLFQASGRAEASCVDPTTYSHRFLEFFDEYTSRGDTEGGVEMTLSLHESRSRNDLDAAVITNALSTEESLVTPVEKQSMAKPTATNRALASGDKKQPAVRHPAATRDTEFPSILPTRSDDTEGRSVASAKSKDLPDVTVIEPAKKTLHRDTTGKKTISTTATNTGKALHIVEPTERSAVAKKPASNKSPPRRKLFAGREKGAKE
ncbi:hypothetical protein ACA910_012774 [Epithemia clementina (nom. ined.)]